MDKQEISFDDFLREVSPDSLGFFTEMHDFLLSGGCKLKIELAKSGYVVSYTHTRTKRVILNYVFRKNAVFARIYGDNVNKYENLMDTLTDGMIKAIEKASVCKRLIDPEKCNSRCPMGYDFTVKGNRHQKCRYGSFMFEINAENIPCIKTFIENEVKERTA